jgi:hypothetical protein
VDPQRMQRVLMEDQEDRGFQAANQAASASLAALSARC